MTATDAVAATGQTVPDGHATKLQTLIKRTLPIFVGGFFVLAGFMICSGFVSEKSVLQKIPNQAFAAVVLPANSVARENLGKLAPLLNEAGPLVKNNLALVVFISPIEIGLVGEVESPEELFNLGQEKEIEFRPLGNGLVAVGSPSFGKRVAGAEPIPWWIRARLAFAIQNSDGALLFSPTIEKPWQLGSLQMIGNRLKLTVSGLGELEETERTIETVLQETIFALAEDLFPAPRSMVLPDGSRAKELRLDTDSFSWETRETEKGVSRVLKQGSALLFSYERGDRISDSCLSEPRPGISLHSNLFDPPLFFSIFLLKKAVVFCF